MYDSGVFGQDLRVLIVDDCLDSRELLTLLFAEYGVETITATSVSEAVELIQQTLPDLVISEIALPDEDGYALIKQLNALQVQLPVIALTLLASKDDRRQALAGGFCQYLSKPLDLDQLIETVASVAQQVQAAKVATV